ncbi:MAG: hypothetical protein JO256_05720 [Alphaproteobacteria bacterium]|nr:hypothetical protein [Alphaproteobacteria bacterium]
MKTRFLLIAILAATSVPALADGDYMVGTSSTVTGYATTLSHSGTRLATGDDPAAARDGCINVPGVAHNSSDCSPMTWMDPNTVLPNKPLNQLTGAEENLIRSYNILVKNRPADAPPPRIVSFSRR